MSNISLCTFNTHKQVQTPTNKHRRYKQPYANIKKHKYV